MIAAILFAIITTASEYQYVSGLDKIEIDGNVMPLRSGDDKNKLRGVDIAFIEEGACERYFISGGRELQYVFTNGLNKTQIQSIYTTLDSQYRDASQGNDYGFLKNPLPWSNFRTLSGDIQEMRYIGDIISVYAKSDRPYITNSYDNVVYGNDISNIFDSLKQLTNYCCCVDHAAFYNFGFHDVVHADTSKIVLPPDIEYASGVLCYVCTKSDGDEEADTDGSYWYYPNAVEFRFSDEMISTPHFYSFFYMYVDTPNSIRTYRGYIGINGTSRNKQGGYYYSQQPGSEILNAAKSILGNRYINIPSYSQMSKGSYFRIRMWTYGIVVAPISNHTKWW